MQYENENSNIKTSSKPRKIALSANRRIGFEILGGYIGLQNSKNLKNNISFPIIKHYEI